jgi:hypothetical protein
LNFALRYSPFALVLHRSQSPPPDCTVDIELVDLQQSRGLTDVNQATNYCGFACWVSGVYHQAQFICFVKKRRSYTATIYRDRGGFFISSKCRS